MGESSILSRIRDSVKELTHEVAEHAVTHGVAHGLEQTGKSLSKALMAPYPGTALARPHSSWLWRAVPGLEGAGEILGSKAFGIATEVLSSSNNTPGSSWERRQNEEYARRQRVAEKSTPKVEQGIPSKDGSVYFPQSRNWVLPGFTITPSRAKHQEIAGKRPSVFPISTRMENGLSRSHVAPTGNFSTRLAGAGFGANQNRVPGLLKPTTHLQPAGGGANTHMRLSLPRLGQSMPFRPITRPSFGIPQLRPPSLKGGFR